MRKNCVERKLYSEETALGRNCVGRGGTYKLAEQFCFSFPFLLSYLPMQTLQKLEFFKIITVKFGTTLRWIRRCSTSKVDNAVALFGYKITIAITATHTGSGLPPRL